MYGDRTGPFCIIHSMMQSTGDRTEQVFLIIHSMMLSTSFKHIAMQASLDLFIRKIIGRESHLLVSTSVTRMGFEN